MDATHMPVLVWSASYTLLVAYTLTISSERARMRCG